MSGLFSELKIKNKTIKNRIVMPPMVCFGWSDNSGVVVEENIRHYEKRSEGGVGVIILEATCVNKDGRLADTQLGIWSDEHIEGLKKITEACSKHDALTLIQIHHAGLKTPKKVCEPAIAPSDYEDGNSSAVAMSLDQIKEIQLDFIAAARRARLAGFDGVELHGAHGYLIDQFASPLINHRKDIYGGSLQNRMRFAVEIVEGIRKELGEDFIIGYRMGGNEPTLEEGIEIATILENCGVDLLHVSAGISKGEPLKVPEGFKYNWIVYVGTEIKKVVNIPVIVVNGIRTPEQAAYLVASGLADFAAIGRGLLVDSQWAVKAKLQTEVKSCYGCPKCSWFKDGKLCPQY
jgi:NADPH2 dehydrogenase